MTVDESVKLMIDSSDYNPYSGPLSKEENLLAAIELAMLCKEFAENGHMDEAMDHDANHWQKVIDKLKGK